MLQAKDERAAAAAQSVGARAPRAAVLELDPDLGTGLQGEHFELASRELTAPVRTVETDSWRPSHEFQPPGIGILVVHGTLAREVRVSRQPAYTELLGPGDLFRPWAGESGGITFCVTRWRALEPTSVALLDERFASRVWRWPTVGSELVGRALRRARSQTMSAALASVVRVDERLLLLFAQLTERWGRVTPAGVTIRLPLTHEMLSSLVGARRPSVTTALGRMSVDGLLVRSADDAWVLTRAGQARIAELCCEPYQAP